MAEPAGATPGWRRPTIAVGRSRAKRRHRKPFSRVYPAGLPRNRTFWPDSNTTCGRKRPKHRCLVAHSRTATGSFAYDPVAVRVTHVPVGRMGPVDRCTPIATRLGPGDPAVAVVVVTCECIAAVVPVRCNVRVGRRVCVAREGLQRGALGNVQDAGDRTRPEGRGMGRWFIRSDRAEGPFGVTDGVDVPLPTASRCAIETRTWCGVCLRQGFPIGFAAYAATRRHPLPHARSRRALNLAASAKEAVEPAA